MIRALCALCAALLVASPAQAQPVGRRRDGGGAVDRRERIKKRIRALRAYTLTDELGLDEATASKLFPILGKYDEEIGKKLVARAKLRQDLEAAGDDAATDRIIDKLLANQKALQEIEEQRFAELREVLTPQQAGRLLVVLPALERRVQNMLERAMTRRRARPAIELDDDGGADGDLGENPYR